MSGGDGRTPVLRKDSTGEHGHASGNRGSSNATASLRSSQGLPNGAVNVNEERIRNENGYGSLHDTLWGHPHSDLCHVQKYTASCKNVTKVNLNRRRTLKFSGSVFGSPKRLDKWMSRNAGI